MGDVSLTTSGLVTGTPAYLAPEVARGEPATPASDVFSLGSTLYTVLEGPDALRHATRTRWPCCTGSPPARSTRRAAPVR